MSADVKFEATPTMAEFMRGGGYVRLISGPVACVDAETEFLSPDGWKPISTWKGEQVAQWSPDGTMEFVEADYIKSPCKEMLLFDVSSQLCMAVTPNHRMPLYDWKGRFTVKYAANVARRPSKHIVPVTFEPVTGGIGLSPKEIRLRVMIAADGHYPRAGKQCRITVRKERKKVRIRQILAECGIEWNERTGANRPTEVTFTFERPAFPKPLHQSANWYQASRQELQVLLDEVLLWDGLHDNRMRRFDTAKREEAEVVQFAALACGYVGRISVEEPKNERCSRIWHVSWPAKHTSAKNKVALRSDNTRVTTFRPKDGMQYCFSVPSSFWIARRDGRVFVTGNSGKSVCCIHELVRLAASQAPDKDNVRRTRFALVRNTYSQLKTTLMKTVFDWLTPGVHGTWRPSDAQFTLHLALPDNSRIHSEWIFMPLERPDDVRKLLSLELSGAYINEAREVRKEIIDGLLMRLDRYPSRKGGNPGCTRPALVMDTNMPAVDSPMWEIMENLPQNWQNFTQPPAILSREEWIDKFSEEPPEHEALEDADGDKWWVNPDADNLKNLSPSYYPNIVPGKDKNYIDQYLRCRYGHSLDGVPVFGKVFSRERHVLPDDKPPVAIKSPEYPIVIGLDFGRTPAAVLLQKNVRGQVRALAELTSEGIGIETFVREHLKPLLTTRFLGCTFVVAPDPAGRAKDQVGELSPGDVLMREGFKLVWPTTNDPELRIAAVERLLTRRLDEKPGIVVASECRELIKALGYGYRYRVKRDGNADAKPEKNWASHIADALQYGSLVIESNLLGRALTGRREIKVVSAAGWT